MQRRVQVAVILCAVVIAGCGGSDESTATSSTTRGTPVATENTSVSATTPPDTTQPPAVTTTVEPTTVTSAPDVAAPDDTSAPPTEPSSSSTAPVTTGTQTAPDTTGDPNDAAGDDGESVGELRLSDAGIGAAEFGTDPDEVVSMVSSVLGEPTADTGYVDPFTIGACPGSELRLMSWGALTLAFGDVSRLLEGRRHFFAYSYGLEGQPDAAPVGLATAEGITVGSTLSQLRVAFPGLTVNPADEFTPPNFFLDDNFRGYLTGLADDSTVSVVFGGAWCLG